MPTLPPFPQHWKTPEISLGNLAMSQSEDLKPHPRSTTATNNTEALAHTIHDVDLKAELAKEVVAKEEAQGNTRTLRNRIQNMEGRAATADKIPSLLPPRVPAAYSRCEMPIRLDSSEEQGTGQSHRDSSIERSYSALGTEVHSMATPKGISQAPTLLQRSSFWV